MRVEEAEVDDLRAAVLAAILSYVEAAAGQKLLRVPGGLVSHDRSVTRDEHHFFVEVPTCNIPRGPPTQIEGEARSRSKSAPRTELGRDTEDDTTLVLANMQRAAAEDHITDDGKKLALCHWATRWRGRRAGCACGSDNPERRDKAD